MAVAVQLPRQLRFADFEVDLRARELRKNGARLKIQEQSFQVLEALLERPGELVTRDEVRNRLWPADTFVDFEDGLNTAVRKLRGVLGDSSANPRFVETIPRRGYRFIHGVHAADGRTPTAAAWWNHRTPRLWLMGAMAASAGLLILVLHAERSRALARKLDTSRPTSAAARAVQPEAFDAFVAGRKYFHRGTGEGSLKAKEFFQRAIEKDPGYAEAYAGLAELYVRGGAALVRDPLEGRVNARKLAKTALALNDRLAEPHAALGWADMTDWDWASAEREFRRAVELNPSYSLAQIWYAEYLAGLQRFDEAHDRAALALQLDPSSPYVNSRAGWVYFYSEQDDKALACWRRVLQTEPNLVHARIGIAHLLITQGKYSAVVGELETETGQENPDSSVLGTLAYAYAKVGRRDKALALTNELERRRRRENVPSLAIAYAYLGLGDVNRTFSWLQIGYQEHAWMYHLNVNRLLAPLRADPRFIDLVQRVGLPRWVASS